MTGTDIVNVILMLMAEVIAFCMVFLLYIHYDKDYKDFGSIGKGGVFFLSIAFFMSVLMFLVFRGNTLCCIICAAGCGMLLAGALLDYATTLVPDMIHYLSIVTFIPLIVSNVREGDIYEPMDIVGYVIFILLQFLIFSRTFGFSDVLAFSAFGTLYFSLDKGWEYMMGAMTLSYVFLIIVQAFKKNINRKLRLNKPVAFIPYIFVAYEVVSFF